MPMDSLEVLKAACCVAGLDGSIGPDEEPIVRRLAERAGVGAASLEAMMELARTDPTYFERQLTFLRGDPERAISTLFETAAAGGGIDEAERIVIRHFSDRLGLTGDRFEALLAAAEQRGGPGDG